MPDRLVRMIVEEQKKMLTAPPSMTVDEAARLMKKNNVGAMMVVDKSRLVGIFTERDGLFRVLATNRDPHATTLTAVMTRNPKTVSPDKPFGYALFMMYEGRIPAHAGRRKRPADRHGVLARCARPRPAAVQRGNEKREHIGEILG